MTIDDIMDSEEFKELMAPYDSGPVCPNPNHGRLIQAGVLCTCAVKPDSWSSAGPDPKAWSEAEVILVDVWASEAQPSPDGRRIHESGEESKPLTVGVRIVGGTADDGVVINGGDWGVVVENSKGRGTIHVWTTGFNQTDPTIVFHEGDTIQDAIQKAWGP